MKSLAVVQQVDVEESYTVLCYVARREASSLVPIFAAVKELTGFAGRVSAVGISRERMAWLQIRCSQR